MVYFLKFVKYEENFRNPIFTGIVVVEVIKGKSINRKEKDMRENTYCFLEITWNKCPGILQKNAFYR